MKISEASWVEYVKGLRGITELGKSAKTIDSRLIQTLVVSMKRGIITKMPSIVIYNFHKAQEFRFRMVGLMLFLFGKILK